MFVRRAIDHYLKGKRSRRDVTRFLETHPDLDRLAERIADEIREGRYRDTRITYFNRVEPISGKHRVIGRESVRHQIYDHVAVMALLTHGTGRLLTPTGLKHVAARGRAAQGERQQIGRGENENDGDHEYEVHHRPAPIDRAREASRRTTRSTMPTARRRNGNSRPKQATASTTNSRITNSTTHHPRSPKDA